MKQTNDKLSLVWGFVSCWRALKCTWRLRVNPLWFVRELFCSSHIATVTAGMGTFDFLIMYWQHVPSYQRNNSESRWETLFPSPVTNTVELHCVITTDIFVHDSYKSWNMLQGRHMQSFSFLLRNSHSAAQPIFILKGEMHYYYYYYCYHY